MLIAPVLSGKEVLGVVTALNRVGASEFSKADEEVCQLTLCDRPYSSLAPAVSNGLKKYKEKTD